MGGGMGGGMGGQQSSFGQGGGGMSGRGVNSADQSSSFGGQSFGSNNGNNMRGERNNNMMGRGGGGGGMMQQKNMMGRGGSGGGGMMQQQKNMMGGGGGGEGRMQQQQNMMDRGNNNMMGQGGMAQGNRMGQNNIMRQGNNNMVGGGQQQIQQRQSNGYGLSMDGGYNDDNDYYDPSQPLFGQQYYQRQGSSEDFRQASRYTLPRNQQALGDYDSSYTASYKDDSGLREKRFRGYRMSGSVNDFGWRRGSSGKFRQAGGEMTGSSTGGFGYGAIRGGGGRRDYTPREREMRQQQIDRDEYEDNMYEDRGSNSIRDFSRGSPTLSINRYQDPGIRGGASNRNDFRQGGSTLNNPAARGSRQMLDNRQMGRQGGYDRGIDDHDDYYKDDMRYDEDDRRSMISSGGYGYDRQEDDRRSMNNDGGNGYGRGDDDRRMNDNGESRYDRRDDIYYDPEIVGKQNRREIGKRSVWDNLRDAFNI